MLSILLLQSTLLTNPAVDGSVDTVPVPETKPLTMGILDAEEWSGNADVSITDVTGNSTSSNGAANLNLAWEGDLDKVGLGAHYAGVRTTDRATGDATTTSRLYQYDANYNRFFSEEKNLYGYVNAATRQDEPNGLQMRASGGLGAGYRFHLYQKNDTEGLLNLEAGASYVAENKVGTLNETSGVGRAAFDFSGPLMENFSLTASGEYLNGGDIESYVQDLGLEWKISDAWYLKLSNSIAWDGNPSAGFTSTDRRWNLLIGTSF